MRRVLPPSQFADWLAHFLPDVPRDGSAAWLPVGIVTDRADPKLAHLDGLNLWRAWMLEGIAAGLPRRRRASRRAARRGTGPSRSGAAAGHRRALRRRPLARQLRDLPGDGTRAAVGYPSLKPMEARMKVVRLALVAATLLVVLDRASASAQPAASGAASAADPREATVKTLIGRLDLEKYKATIKGLTQFGDRRQGTERNRKAVDWIEAQLRSYGCPTERVRYVYDPPPRQPRGRGERHALRAGHRERRGPPRARRLALSGHPAPHGREHRSRTPSRTRGCAS